MEYNRKYKKRSKRERPNMSEAEERKKILYAFAIGAMDFIEKDVDLEDVDLEDVLEVLEKGLEPIRECGVKNPYNEDFYNLKKEIESKKDKLFAYQKELNNKTISDNDNEITKNKIRILGADIIKLEHQYSILKEKKEKIDVILCKLQDIRERESIDKYIYYHRKQIKNSWFGSSYDEEKLKKFKERDAQLISETQEKIRVAVRDMEIKEVIGSPSDIKVVVPETILIDGNNMCYKNGSLKIGLAPLVALTNYLVENTQSKVIVIFDPRIESMLKMERKEIEESFNSAVDVNLLQSGRKADEALLDFADGDDTCYIISNDNYNDEAYADKEVIINNRILKHEIIAGRINIPALGIKNIKFE